MNAIEVKNLTKRYKGFALEDISFDLPSGCIMGLVGENGAGKSTTIKLILNLISADSGEVKVFEKDNRTDFKEAKEDIGVVFDEPCLPEIMTAKQTNAVMKNSYKNWDEKEFFTYIKRFALPEDKEFKDFSRGMKMKLSIAVALSHKAKLLILDEPTSGLDPIVRDEILDIFYEFTAEESHSILISSHIVSDLEKLCDYITFIHKGKLLFSEEKDLLLEKYAVVKCAKENMGLLAEEAVVGKRVGNYGAEALVLREMVPDGMMKEKCSIEDIIVFMAKGEK